MVLMALHIDDIKNSPLNKPQIEVNAKEVDISKLQLTELPPPKPKIIEIKVKKSTKKNGVDSTHDLTLTHEFRSAAELNELLDAVGYNDHMTVWDKSVAAVKAIWNWIMHINISRREQEEKKRWQKKK